MRPNSPSLTRILGVALAAALALAGCRAPFGLAGLAVPPAGSSGQIAHGPQVARTATLTLRVKWPERDFPGFRAASIPQTTNTLVVTVSGAGRQTVSDTFSRPAGPATEPVTHTLTIAEGTGLTIEVKAYREQAPVPVSAVPVAAGSVAGINALAGERVPVALTLTAAFAPKITSLGFNGAPTLQTLTITGENFGTGDMPVKVTFDGVEAAQGEVNRASDTSMQVKIPANARTGPLIVETDGIASPPDTVFWVMQNDLPDSPKIWVTYGEGATSISLRVGQSAPLVVQESKRYLFAGSKTEADFPDYAASKPVRKMEVSDATVGKMTGDTFEALGAGSVTVKARLGWVESNALAVTVSTGLRISTVAGSGGGAEAAANAGLFRPFGLAAAGGALVLSEWGNQRVRSLSGGAISPLAGVGSQGFTDGASTSAQFRYPAGIAADASGSVYLADRNNHAIRKIDQGSGTVATFVGNGSYGFGGDGYPAAEGRLDFPEGVCLTASGDVVIADTGNHKIRIVVAETGFRYGQQMEAGYLYTLAGWIKDPESGYVDSEIPAGARFSTPTGVAAAADGTIFVADSANGRIRRIDTTGAVTTVAGTGIAGSAGDGGPAVDAQFVRPTAVAVGPDGTVYVADRDGRRVRAFVPGGNISTMAGDGVVGSEGDGGLATAAHLTEPTGLAVTADALYIVDFGSDRVRSVALSGDDVGKISTIAQNAGSAPVDALAVPLKAPYGTAVGSGSFLVADSGNHLIRRVDLADGKATILMGVGSAGFNPPGDGADPLQARLNDPIWAIYDAAGNLFVSDAGNQRVRVLPAAGGTLFGVSVTAGLVQTIAGGGSTFSEGGAAVGNLLYLPGGMTFDRDGHLLIADTGSHRIVRVNKTTGFMTTAAGTGAPGFGGDGSDPVAALLDTPAGLATLADGAILIADGMNHRVRRIDPVSGKMQTVAGGGTDIAYGENVAAINAQLNVPTDIVPDGKGGFFFTDKLNHTVRQVSSAGTIVTVAGTPGSAGFSGDSGPALEAKLYLPAGLAIDAAGDLYVADSGNNRIRKLTRQ